MKWLNGRWVNFKFFYKNVKKIFLMTFDGTDNPLTTIFFNELHARTIPENISFIAFSPIFDESNMGPLTKNY